jgi:hypothetical protein
MEKFESLSPNRLLFDLASRLGSLEGYLYAQEKVDKSYLPNWLQNIEQEFRRVSVEVKNEIQPDYLSLLKKIRHLVHNAYGEQDANTLKLDTMIASLPQ